MEQEQEVELSQDAEMALDAEQTQDVEQTQDAEQTQDVEQAQDMEQAKNVEQATSCGTEARSKRIVKRPQRNPKVYHKNPNTFKDGLEITPYAVG